MKCWWTMLMPRAIASEGPPILTAVPSSRISPLSGVGQPVQDVHQRRLAGAVLAEQRVDLARPDLEVDPVVRDDAWIVLGDPAHLERGAVTVSVTDSVTGSLGRIAISGRVVAPGLATS